VSTRFTLSAWFRNNGLDPSPGGEIISVGDNYGLRLFNAGYLHLFYHPEIAPDSNIAWYSHDTQASGVNLIDDGWHHVMGVFDGATLALYVDGKDMGRSPAAGVMGHKFPYNVTIGKHGTDKLNFEYPGWLDDLQIHSAARGADWAKLSYENQRSGGGFPVFGP
jgi:hypothetical protein